MTTVGYEAGRQSTPTTLVASADKFDLYTQAVQAPQADLRFFSTLYEHENDQPPKLVREDIGQVAISNRGGAVCPNRRASFVGHLGNEILICRAVGAPKPLGQTGAVCGRVVHTSNTLTTPQIGRVCCGFERRTTWVKS